MSLITITVGQNVSIYAQLHFFWFPGKTKQKFSTNTFEMMAFFNLNRREGKGKWRWILRKKGYWNAALISKSILKKFKIHLALWYKKRWRLSCRTDISFWMQRTVMTHSSLLLPVYLPAQGFIKVKTNVKSKMQG